MCHPTVGFQVILVHGAGHGEHVEERALELALHCIQDLLVAGFCALQMGHVQLVWLVAL